MRVVVTGPPGSGKTTVLRSPELNAKFNIVPEVAREIIPFMLEYEPLKFQKEEYVQQLIETLQLKQYVDNRQGIFDRGIPDQIAYRRWFSMCVPESLLNNSQDMRYDKVFFFPFWSEIYKQDSLRKETLEEAKDLGDIIKLSYSLAGYNVITVPKATPQERVNFILGKL